MNADRILDVEGVHNFRDFGGYPVVGGGRLKRGMLWRSGQHHGATDADLMKIAALGLASVMDLRSDQERATYPCRRPEGFAATVLIAADELAQAAHAPEKKAEDAAPHVAAAQAPHIAAAQRPVDGDGAAAFASMKRSYIGLPFRPELIKAMRGYIASVAEGAGPSLVNCMAGKDRTGVAVAMLQHAVGVHRDDILEDYLLTNTAGNVEKRIAEGMVSVRSLVGNLSDEFMRVLLGVDQAYLDTAFAAMAEKYGSVENYMKEALGVDDAMREKLKKVLVEA
ncbi:MAG TPA: tyrosine-protein phosphatase [Novosphingobium sp.]